MAITTHETLRKLRNRTLQDAAEKAVAEHKKQLKDLEKKKPAGKTAKLTIKTTPAATTPKPGRRDARYHCKECPPGRANTFTRLTGKGHNYSASFEKHVEEKHLEYLGDFKDLLGEKTFVWRKGKE